MEVKKHQTYTHGEIVQKLDEIENRLETLGRDLEGNGGTQATALANMIEMLEGRFDRLWLDSYFGLFLTIGLAFAGIAVTTVTVPELVEAGVTIQLTIAAVLSLGAANLLILLNNRMLRYMKRRRMQNASSEIQESVPFRK